LLECFYCQDHYLNIQTHTNLGFYHITLSERDKVVRYLLKGIYLMLLTFGETSPDLFISFANLARIYQIKKEYGNAIKCYRVAMRFVEQIHGKNHVKMSLCHTSLATIYYEMSDIKTAIEHQKENVSILRTVIVLSRRFCQRKTPSSGMPSKY
jgi:tetratricopeptide (TPR) repeat protein